MTDDEIRANEWSEIAVTDQIFVTVVDDFYSLRGRQDDCNLQCIFLEGLLEERRLSLHTTHLIIPM